MPYSPDPNRPPNKKTEYDGTTRSMIEGLSKGFKRLGRAALVAAGLVPLSATAVLHGEVASLGSASVARSAKAQTSLQHGGITPKIEQAAASGTAVPNILGHPVQSPIERLKLPPS